MQFYRSNNPNKNVCPWGLNRSKLSFSTSLKHFWYNSNPRRSQKKSELHRWKKRHVSNMNQTLLTFHFTDWLIGILIMAFYNPYITGQYNPLYTANNKGLGCCSCQLPRRFANFGGPICEAGTSWAFLGMFFPLKNSPQSFPKKWRDKNKNNFKLEKRGQSYTLI